MAIQSSILSQLRKQQDLTESDGHDVAIEFLNGGCDTGHIVEVLRLLQEKGESVSEILGFIKAMRTHMRPLTFTQDNLIDICGTGGSLPNRFNVSTCVALVLGQLGYAVAKHGNRGSKKANGSFDFLDAMGIPYELSQAEHQARLDTVGCTFLFARLHHPAVRHVAEARQQLPSRSIFNLIGPFCNPASPSIQIIGTPSADLAQTLLSVGRNLPYQIFAVITSDIGLDECSTVGRSHVHIHNNGHIRTVTIDPTEYGIHHTLDDILVNANALATDNADAFQKIVSQNQKNHPLAQLIALNVAVILHIMDETIPIQDGLDQALSALFSLSL